MLVASSTRPAAGDETGGVGEAFAASIKVVRGSGLLDETDALFTTLACAIRP
jgi:hypothetical protein